MGKQKVHPIERVKLLQMSIVNLKILTSLRNMDEKWSVDHLETLVTDVKIDCGQCIHLYQYPS